MNKKAHAFSALLVNKIDESENESENADSENGTNRCEDCPVETIRIWGDDRSLSCRELGQGNKSSPNFLKVLF